MWRYCWDMILCTITTPCDQYYCQKLPKTILLFFVILRFFCFSTPKRPQNSNLTWSAQHNLRVPKLFYLMNFSIRPLVWPQICPSFFKFFEYTYSIGTLWNYQNFVKSSRRPFEHSMLLFLLFQDMCDSLLGPGGLMHRSAETVGLDTQGQAWSLFFRGRKRPELSCIACT